MQTLIPQKMSHSIHCTHLSHKAIEVMYSTRRLHKNIVDDNAYLTINDPYVDKHTLPDRWKGKRMTCLALPPNEENGLFTKMQYASEPYADNELYLKTQPFDTRKSGFGSKDASKRDEFTSYIRTEQYRETVRKEALRAEKTRDKKAETGLLSTMREEAVQKKKQKRQAGHAFVYDIGRSRVTPFNPKLARDKYFVLNKDQDDEHGKHKKGASTTALALSSSYRLTSRDIGQGVWETDHKPPQVKSFFNSKDMFMNSRTSMRSACSFDAQSIYTPQYGPISCLKTFYDKSHLKVSGF